MAFIVSKKKKLCRCRVAVAARVKTLHGFIRFRLESSKRREAVRGGAGGQDQDARAGAGLKEQPAFVLLFNLMGIK